MTKHHFWTTERIELVLKLWGDGMSATEISQLIPGTTRNSIIGKIHRVSDPSVRKKRGSRAVPSKPRLLARDASETRSNNHTKQRIVSESRALASDGMVRPSIYHYDGILAVFDELTGNMCRWPIGDPKAAGFKFCGCTRNAGRTYCDHHHAMSIGGRK